MFYLELRTARINYNMINQPRCCQDLIWRTYRTRMARRLGFYVVFQSLPIG